MHCVCVTDNLKTPKFITLLTSNHLGGSDAINQETFLQENYQSSQEAESLSSKTPVIVVPVILARGHNFVQSCKTFLHLLQLFSSFD